MPASQIREVYKPSFSIPVSPEAELNAPSAAPPTAPGPENPSAPYVSPAPSSSGETPFNTEEIGPTSMNKPDAAPAAATPLDSGAGPMVASGGYAAPAGAIAASKRSVTPSISP